MTTASSPCRRPWSRYPCGTSPQEFLDELHEALVRHTEGRLTDDVAMILVDRLA